MEITSYAQLEKLLADAITELKSIEASELDSLLDKDLVFALGDFKIPFKGLGFLPSFMVPNFFFHMTTAYNLLRQKGVQIGKREYLGAMDMNMGEGWAIKSTSSRRSEPPIRRAGATRSAPS